jgi:DNA-binding NarL/FixJ family response regulator
MKASSPRIRERILIVEDEQSILLAITDYLTNLGYEVDGTGAITAAESLLAEKHYAAVISDLRLTGSGANEGLELAEIVQRRFPETEMILLSAYGSQAVEERARAHGVAAFLHKPKPLAELAQIIYSVLAEHAAETPAPPARSRPHLLRTDPALARFRLTPHELQVARLVGEGRGNAEIARELTLSAAVVRAHRDALASRLDPRSRFELALYLVREAEDR